MQPMMAEVDASPTRLLAGSPPEPIRMGVLPSLLRGMLLVPGLQIIDVAGTLRLVRSGRKAPRRRPSGRSMWGCHILLPPIPHLLVTLTLIPALRPIRKFLMLFAPDFSWIARICGSFAGLWVFLRSGLILRSLRKSS